MAAEVASEHFDAPRPGSIESAGSRPGRLSGKPEAAPAPDLPPAEHVRTASPARRLSQPALSDLVALVDIAAILGCAAIISALSAAGSALPPYLLTWVAPPVALAAVLGFRVAGLYRMSALVRVAYQSTRLLIVFAAVAAICCAASLAFAPDHRIETLAWLSATPVILSMGRALVALAFRGLLASKILTRRVVIVGPADERETASALIARDTLIDVQAYVPFPADPMSEEDLRAHIAGLLDPHAANGLDEVVLLVPSLEPAGHETIRWAMARPLRLSLLALARLKATLVWPATDISAISVTVADKPVRGWGLLLKALFDRTAGLAIIALFGLPMLLIALAIKLDSPGPVFFRQRRHGYDRSIFRIWKFRSMTVLEDGTTIRQAQKDDTRVTRVGRFIRRTSLDELPQIFNVMMGEMSLVGPRPHALAHDEYYARLIPTYVHRFRVKPGITGWAQINGLRGETKTLIEMSDRIDHDNAYADDWSLMLDIWILIRTAFVGFIGQKSY